VVQFNSEGSWRAPVPGPPPDPTETTTAAINAALAGLEGLDNLEPVEHVGRFDAVHTALTEALSSIDKV
jgi:hypothetical protein